MSKKDEEAYYSSLLNKLIQSEAHNIWLQSKEDGKALEHWLKAEKRILAEIQAFEKAILRNPHVAKKLQKV